MADKQALREALVNAVYRGPGVGAQDAGAWNREADFAYREIIGRLRLAGEI